MIEGFVKISRYAGMREDLVQAGGGNSAVKISGDRMLIKASGYQMADITENDGYAIVDHSLIRDYFMNSKGLELRETEDVILQKSLIKGKRPSIETFLHSLTGRYSLHTHPVVINALTCRMNWSDELRTAFPKALYVPYAKPGLELAIRFFEESKRKIDMEGSLPDVVFLKNHGLIISGNTPDEVIEKTEQTVRKAEEMVGIHRDGYHAVTEIWNVFPDRIVWKVTDQNVLEAYRIFQGFWNISFCPDCVVFLGKQFCKLQFPVSENDITLYEREYGRPVLVEYGGNLFILADSVKKALEIQSVLSFSAQVEILNKGVPCDYLSEDDQNQLLNWESEKYRKNIK